MTHRASGDTLADISTAPVSAHQPGMLGWWSDCCCAAGSQPGQRSRKKESTFARREQNPSGVGELTWSSSCNEVHWGNVKEQELVSYTKDLREIMPYFALNSMLRKDTMFNVLECFLKTYWGFLHSPPPWVTYLQPRLFRVNLLHWSFIADHGQRYLGCFKCTFSLCDLFTFLWTLHYYDFYPNMVYEMVILAF